MSSAFAPFPRPVTLISLLATVALGACGGGGGGDAGPAPSVGPPPSTASDDAPASTAVAPRTDDAADLPANGAMYANENNSAVLSGPVIGTGELSNAAIAKRIDVFGSTGSAVFQVAGAFAVKENEDPARQSAGVVLVGRNVSDVIQCGDVTGVYVVDANAERLDTGRGRMRFRFDGSAHALPNVLDDGVSVFNDCVPPGGQAFAWQGTSDAFADDGAGVDAIAGITVDGSFAVPAGGTLVEELVVPLSYGIAADGSIEVLLENRDAVASYETDVTLYALDEEGFPLGRGRSLDRLVLGPGESGTVDLDNDFFAGTATRARVVVDVELAEPR